MQALQCRPCGAGLAVRVLQCGSCSAGFVAEACSAGLVAQALCRSCSALRSIMHLTNQSGHSILI